MQTQRGTIDLCLMGVVFDGGVWVAMIWAWLVGVASVLELVFKVGAYVRVEVHRYVQVHLLQNKASSLPVTLYK